MTHSSLHLAYLQNIEHNATLCDCCMEKIRGEWYRCAYCSKDLCNFCERIDEHDRTHLFFVFKAPVDMRTLRWVQEIRSLSKTSWRVSFQDLCESGQQRTAASVKASSILQLILHVIWVIVQVLDRYQSCVIFFLLLRFHDLALCISCIICA